MSLLERGYDPNEKDVSHDESTPIHSIVRSKLKDRAKCLETLLVYGNVDVNTRDAHGMSALHFASMHGDIRCIKLLLAFNADINAVSVFEQTPMNLAIAHYQESVIKLFSVLGGISAAFVMPLPPIPLPPISRFRTQRYMLSLDSSDNELERNVGEHPTTVSPFDFHFLVESRVRSSFRLNEEQAVSSILRQDESAIAHRDIPELKHCLTYKMHNGSRILCLDGVGVRGLVLLETLEHLVNITGQEITDMFDVICGGSIGALIALGLVYGKKTLNELRQILYQLKDEVYGSSHSEMCRLEHMESLLMDVIGSCGGTLSMMDVKEPKVMVFACSKDGGDLCLQTFSNFLNDDLAHSRVIDVARYTMMTPTVFSADGGYIDSCVMANNPCDYMMTRLQLHYFLRKEQCPVSMVVSVGTGMYTLRNVSDLPKDLLPKSKTKQSLHHLQNLLILMKNSMVQSEDVANSCLYRCQQLNIPFYRFSPHLKEKVSIHETDTRKLLNAVLRTRIDLQNSFSGVDDLKEYIKQITKSYTTSCVGAIPSDLVSPSELVVRPSSSDTSSGITINPL
jgi:calcium-independent phospholipase A2